MISAAPAPEAPETADPAIPRRRDVVTRDLIDRWAEERGPRVFARFDSLDGAVEDWTYARFRELVLQTALGLQRLGVGMGDHVLVWLPNGREHVRVFFALNYLGAVCVPINTAYKGGLLAHVVELSDAKLGIVHADLAPRLAEVDTAALETLVIVGGEAEGLPLPCLAWADAMLPEAGELAPPPRPVEPWDPMAIIFTSGTTGPSKAVLMSYLHLWSNAGPESWPFVGEDDRYLVAAPMFHIGGMGPMFVMLARGASFALAERFDTATFWGTVRRTEASVAFMLGVMAAFLEKRPPEPGDADNPLRLVLMVPLAGARRFAERFGVEVRTIFNMTEISTPTFSEANPEVDGACGRARPGVDLRLVDGNDCEVPTGAVGEMILRTDRPWAMLSGYHRNPEATAAAWRNGWFHTGDAFRRDAEGNYFYVDRVKDSIRRRGENISSFEVEAEALAHPDVREAAAVAARSPLAEDDVMICVAPAEGRSVDPAALFEFMRARMAYFMVPRYVRVLDELPKTPTAKVEKHRLRAEGPVAGTWDREAEGIVVKGERFAPAANSAASSGSGDAE